MDTGQRPSDLRSRLASVLSSSSIARSAPPRASAWTRPFEEPFDSRAFYDMCDGLSLVDGTRILARGEIEQATSWLVEERSLEWPDDVFVVGERDDLVIVRDADLEGLRAGGGVLEAPTDALETFRRKAKDLVGYLEARTMPDGDADPAPEALAERAIASRDGDALARAVELSFYPRAERELSYAASFLGKLRAEAADWTGAMRAFERSVEARVLLVGRGAARHERELAWKACATVAEEANAPALAAECAARAKAD